MTGPPATAAETARILIVEDEPEIAAVLEKGFRGEGFTTTTVGDGESVAALVADHDLVLLDLGLPGRDGLEVLSDIRARDSQIPVIILTARDDVADRVGGLDRGADDYVAKPFSFEELLARVRARLRGLAAALVLSANGISLDLHTRLATAGDREETLTTREAALLEAFLRRPGEVLSRAEIDELVWADEETGSNVVDVYVRYLRQKLGRSVVATVRGEGYRLGKPGV
ncbi:MAG TPA: response regulator transcription factor [Acidimicrobiales bacterium]|nr:response regulator transcription factor [Acidimicrobiales bacterium]